jgi:DNA-binding CsgD family transcriptional regulator
LAAARLGELDQARELVEDELSRAHRFGAPRPIGVALRASALVEGGDEGIERLREAVTVLASSPATLEHTRALVDLGGALRRAGHRADARHPLRQALATAEKLGLTALERRAHDELAATGARPRRRHQTGLDSLTPSERRVAQMAATGMTNREIAQALFVTTKAVQFHLGNTYRKLDITSRDQLGEAFAARQKSGRGAQ